MWVHIASLLKIHTNFISPIKCIIETVLTEFKAPTGREKQVVGTQQEIDIRTAVKVCLCRDKEEIQTLFNPDELKRAMKKIKEDSNSVSTDQQVTACTNTNLPPLSLLLRLLLWSSLVYAETLRFKNFVRKVDF